MSEEGKLQRWLFDAENLSEPIEEMGILQKDVDADGLAGLTVRAYDVKCLFVETEKDLDHIIQEIEHNATDDTLFERMVLARLKNFRKEWFKGIE